MSRKRKPLSQVGAAWLALQKLLGTRVVSDGAAAEAWLLALLRASIERELAEQDAVGASSPMNTAHVCFPLPSAMAYRCAAGPAVGRRGSRIMASSAGGSCCHLHFNSTLDCPSRHAAHPTPSSPSLLAQGKCDPDSPPARRLSLLPAPADAAGGPTARGELARLLRHTLARARPGANPALRLVRAVRRLLLHAKRAAAVEAAAALDVGEPEPDWGAAGGAAALGPDGAVAEPGEAAAGGGDAGGGADAELAEGRGGEGGAFGVRNGPGEGQALQGGLSAASHALGAAMPEHVVDESDRERSEAAPVGTADVTKEEGGTAEHGAAGSSGQASEAACASQALPGAGAAQVAEGLPGADLSAQGTAPGGGGAEPGARSAAAPGSVSRPESEAGSPAGGAHEDGSGAGGARDAGGAGARGDPADAVDEERSSAGSLHGPAAGGGPADEGDDSAAGTAGGRPRRRSSQSGVARVRTQSGGAEAAKGGSGGGGGREPEWAAAARGSVWAGRDLDSIALATLATTVSWVLDVAPPARCGLQLSCRSGPSCSPQEHTDWGCPCLACSCM